MAAGGGVLAGVGAEGGAAGCDGGDEVLVDFFTKSACGSAVTAGAGALLLALVLVLELALDVFGPALPVLEPAAAGSGGTSGAAGLLCNAPLGFQSLFFWASTASWSAERV